VVVVVCGAVTGAGAAPGAPGHARDAARRGRCCMRWRTDSIGRSGQLRTTICLRRVQQLFRPTRRSPLITLPLGLLLCRGLLHVAYCGKPMHELHRGECTDKSSPLCRAQPRLIVLVISSTSFTLITVLLHGAGAAGCIWRWAVCTCLPRRSSARVAALRPHRNAC